MRLILILWLLPFSLAAQYDVAKTFINTLDSVKITKTLQPFEIMSRYEWHYLPATTAYRNGVGVKELDSLQKAGLYNMLKVFLSDHGYKRTQEVMQYEYLLKALEPNNPSRVPENYFVAFYGDPRKDSTWGWKFSGHHVALNFTIVDGKLAFAPFFFGAYPAEVKEGPNKGRRLIKDEEDLAFELVNSFTPQQKSIAVFQINAFTDIVTKNSAQVSPLEPMGILVKELTPSQEIILNKLIVVYLSSMPNEIAKIRMNRIALEDINEIRFGWAGGLVLGEPHYYRIQGKTFLIEFDNSQNDANHIHTVWRDFNGDYGNDLLKEHYQNAKHHK